MSSKTLFVRYLSLAVVFLFVGVAVAPAVYSESDIDEESSFGHSPLFAVRTKQALNQDVPDITVDTISCPENDFLFPIDGIKRNPLLDKVIQLLLKLDNKELIKLQEFILSKNVEYQEIDDIYQEIPYLDDIPVAESYPTLQDWECVLVLLLAAAWFAFALAFVFLFGIFTFFLTIAPAQCPFT